MSELKTVLMERDDLTEKEADEIIDEMKQRVLEGDNPVDVLYDEGLESDYFMDIMPF